MTFKTRDTSSAVAHAPRADHGSKPASSKPAQARHHNRSGAEMRMARKGDGAPGAEGEFKGARETAGFRGERVARPSRGASSRSRFGGGREERAPRVVPLTQEEIDSLRSTSGFAPLGLQPVLLAAVQATGYTQPTPVQEQAIPLAMQGHDLLVSSSTGSGKTAAFVLPCLARILAAREASAGQAAGVSALDQALEAAQANTGHKGKGPSVLVLAPTRELALQVAKAAQSYGQRIANLRVATVVGGVPYGAQLKALSGPLDILIATPGRLIDHLDSGKADLSGVRTLVLDEADRMLDMGFIEDIESIADCTPQDRQTVLFSATFAGHVSKLAREMTRQPKHVDIASHTEKHDNIEQRLYWTDHTGHKHDLLDHFLTDKDLDQAVVFTSTQVDADRLAFRLGEMGHSVAALHGGMPQGRRNRVLQALRQRELRVLVATDVAARGIDVPTITHVINYGMPMKEEDYVHRIGRTGRAGRSGLAITLAGRADFGMIKRIERFTTQPIPEKIVAGMEPKPVDRMANKVPSRKPPPGRRGGGQGDFRGAGAPSGGRGGRSGFGGGGGRPSGSRTGGRGR